MIRQHTDIPEQVSHSDYVQFQPSVHSRHDIKLRQKGMLLFDDVEQPSHQFHVLVVHQRPDTLEMITALFRKCGYYVTTACSNDEVLIALNQNQFDLVFSDFDSPLLNGYHLARLIKTMRLPTKIVAMTGRCQAEIADVVSEQAIDGWLFKPFKLKTFKDLLKEIGLEPRCAAVQAGCSSHHRK